LHFTGKVAAKAIIAKDGEVLLVRDRRDDDLWDLPGGRMNIGESIEAALLREIREELGIDTHFKAFVCSEQVLHVRDNLPQLFITCEVLMDDPGQSLRLTPKELAEVKWVDEDDAKNFKIHRNSEHALRIYWRAN
jgi:8-oxo-dGTP diphosphatase